MRLPSGGTPIIVAVLLAFAFLAVIRVAASRYRKIPPGTVGVFYGREFKGPDGVKRGYYLNTSGGRVQRPIIEAYVEFRTTAFQIGIQEEDVPNKDNVKIRVKGVATCKVSSDPANLHNAVSSLLDKLTATSGKGGGQQALEEFVSNILKGHLRSIIGKLDINGLLRERDEFNKSVLNESKIELSGLGIDLMNLVIQDIDDKEDYINSLGRKAVAKAKAEADVEVSNAQRSAKLVEAQNEAAIAEAEKDRDVKKSTFKVEADTKRAEADMAFQIANAARQQQLVVAEADRDAAQKTAQVKVQEQEAVRMKAELQATVVQPAEAAKQKAVIDAEANKQTKIIDAEAQAAVLTATAEAKKNASTLEGQGNAAKLEAELTAQAKGDAAKVKEALLAQADGLKELSKAAANMSTGAVLTLLLDRAPVLFDKGGEALAKVAEAIFKSVAAPLGNIDNLNIVDMGGGSGTSGLDKLSTLVPKTIFGFLASAKAAGLDFTKLLELAQIDPSQAMRLLGTFFGGASGGTVEASAASEVAAHPSVEASGLESSAPTDSPAPAKG